ncbi:hypothetical protein JCM8547_007479 [Rhodosporidiobolus lusitaniae]
MVALAGLAGMEPPAAYGALLGQQCPIPIALGQLPIRILWGFEDLGNKDGVLPLHEDWHIKLIHHGLVSAVLRYAYAKENLERISRESPSDLMRELQAYSDASRQRLQEVIREAKAQDPRLEKIVRYAVAKMLLMSQMELTES